VLERVNVSRVKDVGCLVVLVWIVMGREGAYSCKIAYPDFVALAWREVFEEEP
jgi:hypothetical protein